MKLNPHELLNKLRSPEDLANVKSALAALALSRNEIDTAEQIYTQLLAFWRDPSRTKVSQEIGSTLNNLGIIALRRGRFELARARLEEALTVWQTLLGPGNPNLAKAMSNVAMVCMRLKQYDAAAMWMGRANEIAQSAFGESHPFTIAVQVAYADALKKAGRKSEASEIAKLASAARKTMRNPSTSSYTINYRDLLMTGSRRW
jgi:tetratricopeptide (TPR) repeat protein